MTTYTLSARLVDVCGADYVLDHCNGDDELLIGVSVGPHQFKSDDILAEAVSESEGSEKVPEGITAAMLRTELESPCMSAAKIVGDLLASGLWDNHDESSEEGYEESDSMAWIRITWAEDDCDCE